jgi:acyl-CoA synthetase (NDP forming)
MTGTSRTEWLRPLFEPRSIAVIGASGRAGRPGYEAVASAGLLGWNGRLYPVTPKYDEIAGHRCYPEPAALPEPVDLAIIASAAQRMEQDLDAAIRAGARSALIFAIGFLAEDSEPPLLARIAARARAAGIPLLGPNTIGYANHARGVVATWEAPVPGKVGDVALIMQSGATYAYSTATDPRLSFCITGHPGQEAVVTVADLADYALELPETKVLGLYLEAVRDPRRFVACLEKAAARDVPVVIMKPGRSAASQAAIATHTGRMAGGDAVIDAVLRRHGAIRAATMDEWWTTLHLMASAPRLGPGGLAVVTDSGGQRAVLLDEIATVDVPLVEFSEATRKSLRAKLAPELKPENPLDLWGGEADIAGHIEACLLDAANDPGTAVAAIMTEFGVATTDEFANLEAVGTIRARKKSPKPIIAITYSARQFYPDRTMRLTAAGVPVLDGNATALRALKHAFAYRDFRAARRQGEDLLSPAIDSAALRGRIAAARGQGETAALDLLAAAGIATIPTRHVASEDELIAACRTLGFPIALKTAEGHAHKSDVGGVLLGLADEAAALAAYRRLAARLGPAVTVQAMAAPGVELALGVVNDADFGPLVMAATGGILIELLDDRVFELAPVDHGRAAAMIARLRGGHLLDGYRGAPPADRAALADCIVRLSHLAMESRDDIAALDVNPLIAGPRGAVAVDALITFR